MKGPTPPKARGELAEALFTAKAMSLGLVVCRPFGDSAKYDFIVEGRGRLSRVQVKSAWVKSGTGYQISAGPTINYTWGMRRAYRRDEIDFLVAYVAPEDAWFVIPVRAVLKCNYILIRMDPNYRLARYREAWGLLEGRRRSKGNPQSRRCRTAA